MILNSLTRYKMKHVIQSLAFSKWLAVISIFAISCSTQSPDSKEKRPTLGDFAFYRYEVRQGDSTLFQSFKEPGDTSQTFVESLDLHSGNLIMEELMKRLPTMASGDSIAFDFGRGLQGRLHLLHFITKDEYPAYIAEGDKSRAAFEERLEAIKKELARLQPEYHRRAPAVADSMAYWVGELKKTGIQSSLTIIQSWYSIPSDSKGRRPNGQ